MKFNYINGMVLLSAVVLSYAMEQPELGSASSKIAESAKGEKKHVLEGRYTYCEGQSHSLFFRPCNALFDKHITEGMYDSCDIIGCYERAFVIMTQSGMSLSFEEANRVFANYRRMCEEENHKN